jgi:hypothetical protein
MEEGELDLIPRRREEEDDLLGFRENGRENLEIGNGDLEEEGDGLVEKEIEEVPVKCWSVNQRLNFAFFIYFVVCGCKMRTWNNMLGILGIRNGIKISPKLVILIFRKFSSRWISNRKIGGFSLNVFHFILDSRPAKLRYLHH